MTQSQSSPMRCESGAVAVTCGTLDHANAIRRDRETFASLVLIVHVSSLSGLRKSGFGLNPALLAQALFQIRSGYKLATGAGKAK